MGGTYGPIDLTFANRDDWTLSRILQIQAALWGDKTFLTAPGKGRLSYRETNAMASQIAGGLEERGFKSGDRLQIYLDNCPEYILSWFGASRIGVVEVPINTDYFGSFLAHCVDLTRPRGVVVHAHYVDRYIALGEQLKTLNPAFFIVGEDAAGEVKALRALGYAAEHFDEFVESKPIGEIPIQRPHELGAIVLTSGTTGRSKGVMMPHAQLYFFSQQCVNLVRLTENDVYLTANPLFHGNAQFLTTYPALIAGASMFLYEKFSPSQFSARLAASQATVTNFVGVMMDWIAKQEPAETDRQSKLRCVFSTPTAWSVMDKLKTRFNIEAFVDCFGQTEICLPILTPYGHERPAGSCGLAVSEWFDLRLANPETDEDVPQGQIGELLIRPRENWIINSGYYGMPEATAAARANLWYHTGDGLRQDQEGWYYFMDRLKDCLRRRGENISSYEVEQPILQHPAVHSAAAVGLPADEEAGEDEVGIFVVAKEGITLTPQEISSWAAERLPDFLVPRFVRILDALPVTPSGKVQKAELRKDGRNGAWDRLSNSDVG